MLKQGKTEAQASGTKLWLILWKATHSLSAHAQKSIAQLDMCTTDFAVLEVLLHKGSLPVNTIGKKVLITSGSITTAVDRLEHKGLVERFDHIQDRRVRLVRLTASGNKLIKTAFAQHEKHLNRAVSALTQKEQNVLVDLLRKLGHGANSLLEEAK